MSRRGPARGVEARAREGKSMWSASSILATLAGGRGTSPRMAVA